MSGLKCTQTDDATVWSKDFVKTLHENNWTIEDIDEGLMLGWFANAIEVSTDIRSKQLTHDEALGVAAQCWCDKQTEHLEMNAALAEAFAERLMGKRVYIAPALADNKE